MYTRCIPTRPYNSNKGERTVSPKASAMWTENINLRHKTIFTSFDQNTAEFYDNHFLLTMICIFWPEFGWNHAMLHYM